jgi:hypothetical protein
MNPKTKAFTKLDRRVLKCVLDSTIEQGYIDPRNKTADQLLKEFEELNQRTEWVLITDHTADWLKRARNSHKSGEDSFSVVAYAIWLEHQINKMVASAGKRYGLTNKLIESLIRHTGTAEKFAWLHLLVSAKPPSDALLNRIRRLVEARNQFVHYKWKPAPEKENELLQKVITDAEKIVKEIRSFSNQQFFHGQKKRVASACVERWTGKKPAKELPQPN